jgi:phosphonate transport system permease protein
LIAASRLHRNAWFGGADRLRTKLAGSRACPTPDRLRRIDADPLRLLLGFGKLGFLLTLMLPPDDGGALIELLRAMAAILAMAFLGRLLGAMAALPMALLGAANIVPARLLRLGLRRFWEGLREVDALIWALIFVAAVGMGPFAGILALAVPDAGTLAKLFSEAIETVDHRPVEGVRATGAGRRAEISYAIMPQVAPVLLSQVLYFFESNTRSATIMGVVGAGGIGLQLTERLRMNDWDQVAFIVLMILVTVAAIDAGSRAIRRRLI